tara:strand:+ start:866 stop:1264 length:399 start_codon:yes stop_codon:yes gene_type:complete
VPLCGVVLIKLISTTTKKGTNSMATLNTIKKLGSQFPHSVYANVEAKLDMAETDAKMLLDLNFIDCTYSNDECATYYFNKDWGVEGAPTIAAILINDRVVYEVYNSMDCLVDSFGTNLSDAIECYITTFGVK